MQSFSSRIWTRVAVSISCDGNHYTTGTPESSYEFIDPEYSEKNQPKINNQESIDLNVIKLIN